MESRIKFETELALTEATLAEDLKSLGPSLTEPVVEPPVNYLKRSLKIDSPRSAGRFCVCGQKMHENNERRGYFTGVRIVSFDLSLTATGWCIAESDSELPAGEPLKAIDSGVFNPPKGIVSLARIDWIAKACAEWARAAGLVVVECRFNFIRIDRLQARITATIAGPLIRERPPIFQRRSLGDTYGGL